ncbi:hypothetical protein B0T24DRAFT_539948 [Lasiosphaeria ovina]|uniref:Uncharacterized protein n=1 Tax=Lasiosphaeria ovina TaxID=92902 RepID=A0AAE0JSD5_9PEZI|nr:hypothetical protein B0T24DRAFT_539948 [Lasiosphaeria ovina]
MNGEPEPLVAALGQTHSAFVRAGAIQYLPTPLTSETHFKPTWTALGGASGIAALMREFSVVHVDALCRALGRTCGASGARTQREEGLSELFKLLYCPSPTNEADATADPRPLQKSYMRFVRACSPDVCLDYIDDDGFSAKDARSCLDAHAQVFQKQQLDACFSPKPASGPAGRLDLDMGLLKPAVARNRKLTLTVLERILEFDAVDLKIDAREFVSDLVLPLLRNLRKKTESGELNSRAWDLVLRCFERWPQLVVEPTALIRLAAKWWSYSTSEPRRQHASLVMQTLLKLAPNAVTVDKLADFVAKTKPDCHRRAELLCLLFRLQTGVHIASSTGSDKQKLKTLKLQLSNKLFTMIAYKRALAFLDLLIEAQPLQTFLQTSERGSILSQAADPDTPSQGDVPILRAFLARASGHEDASNGSWGSHIESLVKARTAKANSNRDWSGRFFWAQSALFLAIAHGSLELYHKTLVWARRFDKDPQKVTALYQASTVRTREGVDLLCGISAEPRKCTKPLAAVADDIATAHTIILHLLDTAAAALREPSATPAHWAALIPLISDVVERRLKHANALQSHRGLSDDAVYELVWAPTLRMLVAAETALLLTPHPSADDARFPALFLADEFLEKKGLSAAAQSERWASHTPIRFLEGLISRVPAQLLSRLASSGLQRLVADGDKADPSIVMELISLLSHSDRPALACPLIRSVVLDRVNDSAWHRKLFSAGFFSRLSTSEAKAFLEDMAVAMIERMRLQANRSPAPDPSPPVDAAAAAAVPSQPQAPFVKVTTVKMLAQVLNGYGSRFVDNDTACAVLSNILQRAKHVDIKVAVAGSLVEAFCSCGSDPFRRTIAAALEEHAVPIAASLNERQVMTESDWEQAAADPAADLPEISRLSPASEHRPMWSLLWRASRWQRTFAPWKGKPATQLYAKMFEGSAANNKRWMALFVAKHGFAVPAGALDKLPAIPIDPAELSMTVPEMPATHFAALEQLVMANLAPPPWLAAVNRAVAENAPLALSKPGRHWLACWGNSGVAAFDKLGLNRVVNALWWRPKDWATQDTTSDTTLDMVRSFLLALAEAAIFYSPSSPNSSSSDLQRTPASLPDTLLIRAEMLRSPTDDRNDFDRKPEAVQASERDADIRAFVAQVRALVDELVQRDGGAPYHGPWARLKAVVLSRPARKDLLRVALELVRGEGGDGDVGGGSDKVSSMAEFLRIELAHDMLRLGEDPGDGSVLRRVEAVLLRWERSRVEYVRESARETIRVLRRQSLGGRK